LILEKSIGPLKSTTGNSKYNPAEVISLMEIELLTGRFHQIRLQLSQINLPLLGDIKYGSIFTFTNHFLGLEAIRLELNHPTVEKNLIFTGEKKLQKIIQNGQFLPV